MKPIRQIEGSVTFELEAQTQSQSQARNDGTNSEGFQKTVGRPNENPATKVSTSNQVQGLKEPIFVNTILAMPPTVPGSLATERLPNSYLVFEEQCGPGKIINEFSLESLSLSIGRNSVADHVSALQKARDAVHFGNLDVSDDLKRALKDVIDSVGHGSIYAPRDTFKQLECKAEAEGVAVPSALRSFVIEAVKHALINGREGQTRRLSYVLPHVFRAGNESRPNLEPFLHIAFERQFEAKKYFSAKYFMYYLLEEMKTQKRLDADIDAMLDQATVKFAEAGETTIVAELIARVRREVKKEG